MSRFGRIMGTLDRLSTASGILALFVVVNLTSLAIALAQTHASVAAIESQTVGMTSLMAQRAADELEERLLHVIALARSVERLAEFWDGSDVDRDRLLHALAAPDRRVNALLFATPDLEQHGASNYPGGARPNLSVRAYAREAVASGAVSATAEPLRALATGEPVLPIAVPVRDARTPERQGLIVVGLKSPRLAELLAGVPLPDGSTVQLVDVRGGSILVDSHEGDDPTGATLPADQLGLIVAGARFQRAATADGVEYVHAWHRLQSAPWAVVIHVPLTAVLAPIYAQAWQMTVVHLTIAAILAAILLLLWRRTVLRLRRLSDAADRWSSGDLAHRSGLGGSDEVGRVGDAFDRMAATLEKTAHELRAQHDQLVRALARREAVLRSARRVAAEEERDDLINAILREAVATANADDGGVTRWDEKRGRLIATRRFLDADASNDGTALPVGSASHRAAVTRAPVFVDAYQREIGVMTLPGQRGAQAALAVPVIHQGMLLGTISVSSNVPGHRFTHEDAEQLELLAGIVAGALVRLDAAEALRRHVERLDTLTRLSTLISRSLDMDDVLRAIANAAAALMDVTVVQCWVADEPNRVVRLRAISDGAAGLAFKLSTLPYGTSAAGWVAEHGEPLMIPEVTKDARFQTPSWWAERQLHCYYGLPVTVDGRVVAVIAMMRKEPFDFGERDHALLRSFASQAAVAVENARLYAEAAASRDAAEAATRVKADFLATMSHEIRTPLNGIIGLSELTLRTELSAEQRQNLEMIARSGDALLRIVNDILDLSKIEAGKLDLESAPVVLHELVRDALGLHAVQAERKGLKLEQAIAPGVPTTVLGDPSRLRQILFNLVGNAVKFTEAGGVTVTVGLVERGDESVLLRFEVHDTGIGIDPEAIPILFQPFTQADRSTTRRYGGTGLGLTISRRLVEQMGGKIGVESAAGRGSTFWFTIRAGMSSARDAGADGSPGDALRMEAGSSDVTPTVLVVDDSPVNRLVAARMLERLGCRATSVESGAKALEALAGAPFSLILTDCYMPEMDGFMLAAAIRQLDRQVPIVAMTADVLEETRARCLKVGMNDCLTKPLRIEQLQAAVERWHGRRQTDDLAHTRSAAVAACAGAAGST